MELKFRTGLPLLIRHLEQIHLWHCARNVEQRVEPSESIEESADKRVRGFRFAQIQITNKRFCAGEFDLLCYFRERGPISRSENDGREIPGEADGRGAADTLARSRHNGNRPVHNPLFS
jgi:hypothetical protein